MRVGYWSIVNIVRRRTKGIRSEVRDKVKAGIVRNIESEITRLENELAVVRHCRAGLSQANIILKG
jgi:hypothetical protein